MNKPLTPPSGAVHSPQEWAVTAPLAQLRAKGVRCLLSCGRTADYVAVPLADGSTIRLTGTTRPDENGTVDDVSVNHPVRAHESWRAELDHAAGSTLVYDSEGRQMTFAEDTKALVAAILQYHRQRGGEFGDQQPPVPAEGESGEEAAPDDLPFLSPLADLADLYGRFEDGYGPDDIRAVFGRIHAEGGPYLVCVWDYADEYGFGGDSQFYAEDADGRLFEVQPDIHRWLSGWQETPGAVDTWVCAPVSEPTEFPVSDDFHNYARTDRTGD
ncbi:hypothetical protein [Streptomyces rubradiris]|uniref:hypothetical protein n=1 Tax=Streptomyces rubradiris TaxID=285531 RepID=UPI0016732F3A|nr:hypothetical protein [Streptomyces rubradiris]